MTSDDRVGLDKRLTRVREERDASVKTFAEGLNAIDQEFNDSYTETDDIYDDEYAPLLFTKGMPLETDGKGARYPEGIVPLDRKLENYRRPIRSRPDFSERDTFEPGGQRLFIGAPGVYTVGLSGMEAWQGRMPPAPDPTGPVTAREMSDVYAMEQLRDVPFTAWPNEPGGDGRRRVSEIENDEDAPKALKDTLDALGTDLEESEDGTWWYGTDRLFVEADTGSDDS